MKFVKNMVSIILVFIIIISIAVPLLFMYYCITQKNKQQKPLLKPKHVTCIMITGKDARRVDLAKASVINFQQQDYGHKQLVILNHHPDKKVLNRSYPNVFEFQFTKHENLTLGDVRNMSLELVVNGEYFLTWDDDDYRDTKFISTLVQHSVEKNADVVAITERLEANITNGYVWKTFLKTGFVHALMKKDSRIKYLSQNTMEDLRILDDYRKNNYKVVTLPNPAGLYIRLVHTNNTSLYVDANKSHISKRFHPDSSYKEYEASDAEINYVINIIKLYYNVVLPRARK